MLRLTRNWRTLTMFVLLLALILVLVSTAAFHTLHPIIGHHIQALADSPSPDVIVHNH